MNKQLPTIKLKGKNYIQVKDRIVFFNETYPNGAISTKIVNDGANMVTFLAVVCPDVDKPERHFTGHAFGTVDEVKAFEKLETVAVGRALAFMGIGVLESVASADEMQRFEQKKSYTGTGIKRISDYEFDTILQNGAFNLDSGVSNKTGKPWFTVEYQDQKYWITEEQHRLLSK